MLDTPCDLWTGTVNSDGYGVMRSGGRSHRVHRLAWKAKHGPIPEGVSVLHRCDMRHCRNVEHLFLGTQADNIADAVRKGRNPHGTSHGCAKLTEAQVVEIRKRYREESGTARERCARLAAEYGVSKSTINHIVYRLRWRHVA